MVDGIHLNTVDETQWVNKGKGVPLGCRGFSLVHLLGFLLVFQ